ncbi:S-methyl-5-thioribose kinase [Sedimentitalea nanhaiensis]|uniref:S-methyl-5-thioribose kinase n=1 Tax=Sedimentitalea nanhaiensis TaxID=999627 RepID=A0A1I7BGJ5_9RHOB|nr:S-methyl-5-thioribose kinase [Sedimentitalea nanhaiensis]SFT86309.1 5'-methylthioribose kinase [Sedimentitalea nanhaiensis]
MSDLPAGYDPLTVDTLGARLGGLADVATRIGGDPGAWDVREVGDGNLNLVFIVTGPAGSVVVKQALPYVRLVGDSWPLPLKRAFFEYHALIRQAARDPGRVPQVHYFDDSQALIVMEFLSPHTILRGRLIAGQKTAGLADTLGRFAARTAFRGSDLAMPTAQRKADAALFLDNVALCDITESLVFTDPYFDAPRNHHTPELGPVVATLRADVAMKTQVQHMLTRFASHGETMLHGDLHTGSVMCTDDDLRVIDPEFACYGPMGFDLGMMLANFLMAYLSQPAHRSASDLPAFQTWILSVIRDIAASYGDEFGHLWHHERTGILYPPALFEDQGHSSGPALADRLAAIWQDAMGFCGIEMHRRVLSLAHNAEFETIADTALRARLEARNLMMGRDLILNRADIATPGDLVALAQRYNERVFP